jgi:hypothetical protein
MAAASSSLHTRLVPFPPSPLSQRLYIRILWMTPIYAVVSWFALRFKEQNVYLQTAREAYEAYVIHVSGASSPAA